MGMRTSESLKIFQGCTSGTFLNVCQLRLDIYVCSIPLSLCQSGAVMYKLTF